MQRSLLMRPSEHPPILIVPYMWIGDFVRCHTTVKLLRERFPSRAVDLLATSLVAPLVDYMAGVRRAIVVDLPRKRLALAQHHALAERLRAERYGQVLIMPRTWKAALAPYLAGIARRTGFLGEARVGLINDLRVGERSLPRMVDRCAALALNKGEPLPAEWPVPELTVAPAELAAWRQRMGVIADEGPVVAIAPGAVGPAKRWPYYRELARGLVAAGHRVWVIGGSGEREQARDIAAADPAHILDLTGDDLRNAVLALKAATAAVSNDSGLLHVAAALGTPSIGVFGPTSPWHWAPLNPLAAVIEARMPLACRPCHKATCRERHHRCMRDISVETVAAAAAAATASRTHAAPS